MGTFYFGSVYVLTMEAGSLKEGYLPLPIAKYGPIHPHVWFTYKIKHS